MYKNRIISLALILAMGCLTLPANAKYYRRAGGSNNRGSESYHFGYISGAVGYTSLDCQVPVLTPSGGVGYAVGLGYEFRNNGFWLSVGPQFGVHRSESTMETTKFEIPDAKGTYQFHLFDTQGDAVDKFYYDIEEHDTQDWQFIEVPILAGWFFHGFHIGLGPKISYSINSTVSSHGKYNLSAKNNGKDVIFKDMPEHGYGDYEYKYTNKATLTPMVSLIGEVGYDVLSAVPTRSQLCHLLRISFYFEYGLNSAVRPVDTNKRFDWEEVPNQTGVKDATKLIVNPYFASGMTERYRVVPFFTGVKITYLIGGSKHARAGGFHKGCQCYN